MQPELSKAPLSSMVEIDGFCSTSKQELNQQLFSRLSESGLGGNT